MSVELTLVVPCYNEATVLERSADEVFRVLDFLQIESELLFVDDASTDDTRTIIDRIIRAHPGRRLRKLLHASNAGRGATVADGIRAADGRLVGFIDIDLEVHPRYIPSCLLALEQGYDVATAMRVYRFSWRAIDRYMMSVGYRTLFRSLFRTPLQDTETGFKFFRREPILDVVRHTRDPGWFWDTEIMLRSYYAGLRIIEIPAVFARRTDKPSTVRPLADSFTQFRKLVAFRREASRLRLGAGAREPAHS